MDVLSIIPARGGSKGIPLKNIQKLNGKPLIEYSISAAKNSKYVNRIIVSTDNEKIAKISKKLGAEVIDRPKYLSQDRTATVDVVKHLLKILSKKENYSPSVITLLQPTTPLRNSHLIDKSIKLLVDSKADTVLGVKKMKPHPFRSFWLSEKHLKPLYPDFLKFHQRQLLPDCYGPTGSIYTFWTKTLLKYGQMFGPKIKPLVISSDTINVDIDSKFEMFVNEMVLKYWKSYTKNF
jgi:CMP-N,N'-diacetyllegionaminic acid synthase